MLLEKGPTPAGPFFGGARAWESFFGGPCCDVERGKVGEVSGCIDVHLLTSNGLHFHGNLRVPPQCTTKTPEKTSSY